MRVTLATALHVGVFGRGPRGGSNHELSGRKWSTTDGRGHALGQEPWKHVRFLPRVPGTRQHEHRRRDRPERAGSAFLQALDVRQVLFRAPGPFAPDEVAARDDPNHPSSEAAPDGASAEGLELRVEEEVNRPTGKVERK